MPRLSKAKQQQLAEIERQIAELEQELELQKLEEKYESKYDPVNKSSKTVNKYTPSAINRRANRPSPSVPAGDHMEETMEGNDGNMYISTMDKNGVYHWQKESVCPNIQTSLRKS